MTSGRKRFTRVEDFYILETLGVGAFAKVRLAIHSGTHQRYACKILDKSFIRQREQNRHVKNEIDALARLNHKNVVQLVEVINTAKRIYIIMELVSGGELFDVITKNNRLTEPQARYYFHQLVEGVHYCHRRGVFHRDLKLENILLSTDGEVKITDFGLSQLLAGRADGMDSVNSSVLLSTQCGSPFYVAPEVVVMKETRYSGAKADAWACGMILYVLAAGSLPFHIPFFEFTPSGNNALMFKKFIDGGMNFPESFTEELKDLVLHLLEVDPAKRYAMPAVKKHPWFNGPCDDPGRHRSENPNTRLPQVVAASLGSVPLTRKVNTHSSEDEIQNDESRMRAEEDTLMETSDSLNLGKRADSFEGTAPAVLLPMASRYSDVPETDNDISEFQEQDYDSYKLQEHERDAQKLVNGVHPMVAKTASTGRDSTQQFGPDYVNNSHTVSELNEGATTTQDVAAFPLDVELSYYNEEDIIVHNWNVLPTDFEIGEHTYLLSQESVEVSDEKDALRKTNSMDSRMSRSIVLRSQCERSRSLPTFRPKPSVSGNVHPFRNLPLESKKGTVRQQLWELSINQWQSEDIHEPRPWGNTETADAENSFANRKTVDHQDEDYHLVADSVEFGVPDEELKKLWTEEAVFGFTHEDTEVLNDDRPVPEIYSQNGTVLKKRTESGSTSASHVQISNTYTSNDTQVSTQPNGHHSSDMALGTQDSRGQGYSSRNGSSSTNQRSGQGSSRSPEIERLKATEKESLSTRHLLRTSSSRDRRMPSSPRTPRSNKGSRRFRSGHSVDKALLDLSGDLETDQGALRATNSTHQSKPPSSSNMDTARCIISQGESVRIVSAGRDDVQDVHLKVATAD
ncbi:Serine/threonine protein kinase [Gracilaria domingensis]|nr:Serine/threonine protein kinase [Gracilaria domingensis]